MTGPATLGWQLATCVALRNETATVKTIGFELPGWRGHRAGQHVDVRLTAPDGYQAQRSYSIASAAGMGSRIELTVERISGGEVSEFLTRGLTLGDTIEIRGPIGGYFIWASETSTPLMLVGGGSGVVPLMSMLRTRLCSGAKAPARLLYSARRLEDLIYKDELNQLVTLNDGFSLVPTLTRGAPSGWKGETRRIDRDILARHAFPATQRPGIFVCGPTAFVEVVADLLVASGYDAETIKTERFGPTSPP